MIASFKSCFVKFSSFSIIRLKYLSLISSVSFRFVAIGIKKNPFSQFNGAVSGLVLDVKFA